MTLYQATHSRENNFNTVRLTLSMLVVLFHAYAVGQQSDPLSRLLEPYLNIGQLAVGTFFLLSGLFVMQSWLQDPRVWAFMVKRFARVFPGLFVCVLSTTVIAVSFYSVQGAAGLNTFEPWNYVVSNSLLHYLKADIPAGQLVIPGVFANLPNPAMNGSLWSLYWEGKFYVLLALIGMMAFNRSAYWFTAIGTLLIVLMPERPELVRDFVWEFNLLTIFLVGVVLQTLSSFITIRWQHVLAAGLFCYLTRWGSVPFSIYLFCGIAALWVGSSRLPLPSFFRQHDYSYSVYIYHWPILQMLKSSFPSVSGMILFITVTLLLLPISMGSWHFIEKPCMRLGRRICQRYTKPTAMNAYD